MRPLATLVLVSAGAALLSGCGSAWPAGEAEGRFVEHFTTAYPEQVAETVTEASAKVPFVGGELSAVLVLTDDTPPDLFTEIVEEVIAWDAGGAVTYDGRGAIANGVGVCAGDEQRAAKGELRSRLHAAGQSLAGNWPCTTWERAEGASYTASVTDFTTDTAAVRELLGDDADVWVRAELHEPWGTVEAPWAEVPHELGGTLSAVAEVMPIRSFEFTATHGLRVAVPATTDLSAAHEAAERAAGPMPVEVVQGDLDPAKAAEIELLGPVADHVRAVPGVLDVGVRPGHVAISVTGPDVVAAVADAARTHPGLGGASVQLTLSAARHDESWARHRYLWQAGATTDSVPAFVDLTGHDVVATVEVVDPPDGAPRLVLELAAPIEEGLPLVKALVPDGVEVTVRGNDALATVEFRSARTLTSQEVTSRFTTPDLDRIVREWNAAG